ncbi:hypothetical protein ACEPPN_005549 [Leptodophora sp. 'Broadleaf-Isolate-01']
MADNATAPTDTLRGEKITNMFPTIIETAVPGSLEHPLGLAEDFDTWMEVRRIWTWYRKSRGSTTSKAKQTDGEGSLQRLPDPPVCGTTNPRRAFLDSVTESRLLTPSSSNSSILSNNSDSTPPSSSSTSPASSFSESFSAHTPLSTSSPSSTLTPIPHYPSPANDILYSTEYFEVRRSEKGGYGAFATKDIEKEIIVMTEKPLFRATFMEVFVELEKLTKEQRREYRTLHGHMRLSNSEDLAIYKTNRFETCGGKGGIFIKSSRFNHACHPHATCTYRYDESTDTLIFTACNPINKGDEMTISYTSNASQLMDNYGFYCDCSGCPRPKVAAKQARRLRGPW